MWKLVSLPLFRGRVGEGVIKIINLPTIFFLEKRSATKATTKNSMNFTVLVNSPPFSRLGSNTAFQFCNAVLSKGHHIHRVFFYCDGVLNANNFISPPQDESNLVTDWQSLSKQSGVELMVCVAAASRRGVVDEGQGKNLAPEFKISGLGQLIESIIQSDRFITFN
jgi:tRNA 2-thiouridine synthesizing protein D